LAESVEAPVRVGETVGVTTAAELPGLLLLLVDTDEDEEDEVPDFEATAVDGLETDADVMSPAAAIFEYDVMAACA
jgi:hypothetical protein